MRQIWIWLEFWLLLVAQMLCIGFYLSILFPAAAQTPPSQPVGINAFLSNIGGDGRIAAMGDASLPPQRLLASHPEALGYRVIKDKHLDPLQTADRVIAAYAKECASHGGQLDAETALNMRDLLAVQQSLTTGYGNPAHGATCKLCFG